MKMNRLYFDNSFDLPVQVFTTSTDNKRMHVAKKSGSKGITGYYQKCQKSQKKVFLSTSHTPGPISVFSEFFIYRAEFFICRESRIIGPGTGCRQHQSFTLLIL